MSRIAEIEKLRSRMRQHHFVAISGPRNTGKSRICKQLKQSLEAEVKNMKEVERRYKAKAGMKWKVAYIKLNREDNPFDLLTHSIAGPGTNILLNPNEKVDPLFESKVKQVLKTPNATGLMKIYETYLRFKQYNFLLIIDQFENLFFSTILSQEEKHLFVRILLNASLDNRQMYVLVALRPPKADLWKTNFRELNRAIEMCRFRLYNPNQRELEGAIEQAFVMERDRILGDDITDELLSPSWLASQPIYQEVARPKIRNMAEDTAEILQGKWRKMLREGANPNQRMIAPSMVKVITKQLRGITDTIWPQVLNAANVGHLDEDERQDFIVDLKAQLTDLLTTMLLQRMSRHLAEELYFEQEPLTQIEKHVRQLVKDWAEVTADLRSERTMRRKRIKTVLLSEQTSVGAADGNLKFDKSQPMEDLAEQAYQALRTTFDKRIAKKAIEILARTAQSGTSDKLTLDALGFAMGRFSSRLPDVIMVFIEAGVITDDPPGSLEPNTRLELSSTELVDKWKRLYEWINNMKAGGYSAATGIESSGGGSDEGANYGQVDLSLKDFGDKPSDASGLVARAENIYAALTPSLRKRVAKRIMVYMAQNAGTEGLPSTEIKSGIGRFASQIDELLEYFVRQGILEYKGPKVNFSDPGIPSGWRDLQGWVKEAGKR